MGDTKIEWSEKVWNPVTGCKAAGAAPFMKQMGGVRPGTEFENLPPELRVREYPCEFAKEHRKR